MNGPVIIDAIGVAAFQWITRDGTSGVAVGLSVENGSLLLSLNGDATDLATAIHLAMMLDSEFAGLILDAVDAYRHIESLRVARNESS